MIFSPFFLHHKYLVCFSLMGLDTTPFSLLKKSSLLSGAGKTPCPQGSYSMLILLALLEDYYTEGYPWYYNA